MLSHFRPTVGSRCCYRFLFYYFILFILLPSLHKYIKNDIGAKGNPEQAHRPTKWGPLFTHQKPKDKGQAQLQANNRRKQRNAIKSKQNHKEDSEVPHLISACYSESQLYFYIVYR